MNTLPGSGIKESIERLANIKEAIERLTGVKIDLRAERVRGRNIWGRVAFSQPGMIHVEVLPKDEIVNEAVMPSISGDDMQLGREQRRALYRERCREVAGSMNTKAIDDGRLFLIISSNGHLSKKARALIEALL